MNYRDEILHELMNMSEQLLLSGADVNRVEDTVSRMGKAYGAKYMDVFVITSNVMVTMAFPDGERLTQTRRILTPASTDFRRLESLNALSRKCCKNPLPPEELKHEMNRIVPISKTKLICGSLIAAASFTVFYGGNVLDMVVSALFALEIIFLQEKLYPYCTNKVVYNLICSFIVGLCIYAVSAVFPMIDTDKVVVGDIMLLIPGMAFANAIRDILVGDTISGILRLTEALLWAGALACGFMAALFIVGLGV